MQDTTLVAAAAAASYAPRPMTPPAPSLVRHALIPASIVVCFWLIYGLEAPPWWVAVVGGPIVALYLLAPRIGRRSMARFDRVAVQHLAAGRPAALGPLYTASIGMRLFAPPALVAERRGLVAANAGAPGLAREAYRTAHAQYAEGEAPVAVELGLAHASFAIGDAREAILHYRRVLAVSGALPHVARNLAHALARQGEELDDAGRLADEAIAQAPDDAAAKLVRALVYARRGRRGPARKLLRATGDADGVEELREEVETALEEV